MSVDLSTNTDRNLRRLVPILAAIDAAAAKHEIRWFIVGAIARDLLLSYRYGIEPRRLTFDVDLAIAADGWDTFEKLVATLVEDHGFTRSRNEHRLVRGVEKVDIVPFGGLARDGRIVWPPRGEMEMTIVGFEDAFKAGVEVILDHELSVRVASVAGLLLLKFIAWSERHVDRPHHDAVDIGQLLTTFSRAADLDYLYDRGEQFLARFEFDPDLVAAALIGAECRQISSQMTTDVVGRILAEQTDENGSLQLARDISTDVAGNLRLLNAFREGFESRGG